MKFMKVLCVFYFYGAFMIINQIVTKYHVVKKRLD